MFIGWLRNNFFEELSLLEKEYETIDKALIRTTHASFPELCFGAYQKNELVGVITAYKFEKTVFVNNFYVQKNHLELANRLLAIVLKNVDLKEYRLIMLCETDLLKAIELKYEVYSKFTKYIYNGEAVAFNFTNATAKQINNDHYFEVARKIDFDVTNEHRYEYIAKDIMYNSSLRLATFNGFMHSYAVNKKFIKLSPWYMDREAFLDAEKLLRGVIYYRGLKKLFTTVPSGENEIIELLESYKFKKYKDYQLIYFGEKPEIRLESIYGF